MSPGFQFKCTLKIFCYNATQCGYLMKVSCFNSLQNWSLEYCLPNKYSMMEWMYTNSYSVFIGKSCFSPITNPSFHIEHINILQFNEYCTCWLETHFLHICGGVWRDSSRILNPVSAPQKVTSEHPCHQRPTTPSKSRWRKGNGTQSLLGSAKKNPLQSYGKKKK